MEEIKLDVQLRDRVGTRKIKSIRRADAVPAVVYGGGKEVTTIKLDRRTYEKIMRHHQGQSVLFHLNVMEGDKNLKDCSVIVKEEQHDPVTDKLLHIDFKQISLTEEIEVTVPIEAKGDADGVKNGGGSLDHAMWELDIICLPMNIPEKIQVNVTSLKIGDAIHVKDIVLPQGIRTKHDLEAIVFAVFPPMQEEIEVAEEEAPSEPEVLKEKKVKEEAKADVKTEK